jgi:predicted dehydrogenase
MAASAAAGAAMAAPRMAFAQGSDTIKVGLIGCGGRGTGAAENCFAAAPGVELHSMADVFSDRLQGSASRLREVFGSSFKAGSDDLHSGFEGWQKVIESDANLIILTTPPVFRPMMLDAAIKAGKHVFMEKPVAVDGHGIQQVFAASDEADRKGLCIVAGTQRRHDSAYREAMKRIHDGAIGDIVSARVYWNQGGLWMVPKTPEMSEMEWQLRNWLYFTWISGDHIVEQHIHNIDVALWAMQKTPSAAVGLGGRQVRTDPAYGHIFDHHAVEFEFDGTDARIHSYCRQQDNTASAVYEWLHGSKGSSDGNNRISGPNEWSWSRRDARPNPYEQEHKHLIGFIRGGRKINEGRQVAESTLAAIMGRLATYTGQRVTREQVLATKQLMPAQLSWDVKPEIPAVALPGQTKMEAYM